MKTILEIQLNNTNGKPAHAPEDGVADLETAISLTGFGKFHWICILIGGFCFVACGLEYSMNAYVAPSAQCDLHMESSDMGMLHALFLGGGIVSCFLWGALADLFGRKVTLVWTLLIDGVLVLVASLSPSFAVFAVLRFINGFLSGAPGSLVNSYCAEFCSNKHRAMALCITGFFWNLAWMLTPIIAWGIMPLTFTLDLSFVKFNAWRTFTLFIGVPNIVAALLLWYYLPETPKFLFSSGQETEALQVLQDMYATNTGNLKQNYPVKKLVRSLEVTEDIVESEPGRKSFVQICRTMGAQAKELLAPPYLQKTILCSTLYFFNLFGYYGIGMWLPELFNRFEDYYSEYPNQTITVCDLAALKYYKQDNNGSELDSTSTLHSMENCDVKPLNAVVFQNTLYIGVICCIGSILAIVLTYKINAKVLSVSTMGLAGIAGLLIYVVKSPIQILITAAAIEMFIVIGMVVLNYVSINSFPTRMRGMGVCVCIFIGRMGSVLSNIVFGMLIDSYCEIPIFLLGGVVLFGGILSLLLPKNAKKATE